MRKGKCSAFSWHALRHTKGTRMAAEGHDILSIMMELGHSSPDMATVYVNNRLELRKKALMEKGSADSSTSRAGRTTRLRSCWSRKISCERPACVAAPVRCRRRSAIA